MRIKYSIEEIRLFMVYSAMISGLRKLAKIVEKDDSIKEISGASWLVAKYADNLKNKFSFNVEIEEGRIVKIGPWARFG